MGGPEKVQWERESEGALKPLNVKRVGKIVGGEACKTTKVFCQYPNSEMKNDFTGDGKGSGRLGHKREWVLWGRSDNRDRIQSEPTQLGSGKTRRKGSNEGKFANAWGGAGR